MPIREKRHNLIRHRRHRLGAVLIVPACKLVDPERTDDVILNFGDHSLTNDFVGEEPQQIEERAILFYSCEHRISEQVL